MKQVIPVQATLLLLLASSMVRGDCPTPNWPNPQSWQIPAVNYNFPAPGPPAPYLTNVSVASLGIVADIDAAFSEWTVANQGNNANVGFYSAGVNGPFRVYAYRVTRPGVPFEDPGIAAYTTVALHGGTRTIAFVSTDLYLGSISRVGGYPTYDENAPNYHTFIKKVMLHEIGHTMDLAEQPSDDGAQCAGQTAGQSVMNYQCGTNDAANNIPTAVTNCDNASAHY
jgi:hypothetical protein